MTVPPASANRSSIAPAWPASAPIPHRVPNMPAPRANSETRSPLFLPNVKCSILGRLPTRLSTVIAVLEHQHGYIDRYTYVVDATQDPAARRRGGRGARERILSTVADL